MLGNLLNFIMGREPGNGRVPAQAELDELAPEKPLESADTPRTFVCREPVLDRRQRVVGYEFLLQKQARRAIRQETLPTLRLYDQVLLANVATMGIERLLGNRQAFVGISSCSLASRHLEALPADGTVLAVRLLDQRDDAELLERLAALREMGFRIALDDYLDGAEMEPFLSLADYVRFNLPDFDSLQLSRQVSGVVRRAEGVQLIAKNLESIDDFEVCSRFQFHCFQGPYLTRRDEKAPPRADTSRLRVFELLNLVRREADVGEMSQVFKYDPLLSYKLLRYINSPGVGLITKVTSIEHALVVFGHQKLYRWLTLLLFSSGKVDPRDWALMETALVRARLLETLSAGKFEGRAREEVFVVGVFSLLDTLLRAPMDKVVGQLNLPEQVAAALLRREGPYAPYLELAMACETFDLELIAERAAACGLDLRKVNAAQMEALLWAQEIER